MNKTTKKENNIELIYKYPIPTKQFFGFSLKNVSKKILDYILLKENIKSKCEVSVYIVDNISIKIINNKERNINKTTDVLSFPLINIASIKNIDLYLKNNKNKFIDFYNYDTKRIMLGDIVISADKVLSQAIKYNHSIKREFSFLFAHSLLHLLGYDHISKTDEEFMFSKQDKYLYELGIVR